MMASVFRSAYPSTAFPPENLKGAGRPDGYPTADDIAAAYSLLRLFLRVSTEEKIAEPQFPNIADDVWKQVKKTWEDVKRDLGDVPPLPRPGNPAGLSIEDVWRALMAYIDWQVRAAIAIGKAAFNLVKNIIAVGGVLLVDFVKAGLYLVKKALFDIYKNFRDFLVRAGYSMPFTDELTSDLGAGISAATLWHTPAGKSDDDRSGLHPKEELPELERPRQRNRYVPWVPPEFLEENRGPDGVLLEYPRRGLRLTQIARLPTPLSTQS
ncbi:hypothetical protein U8P80_19965 [Rhizobium beringeri]|nr:hypothetical protein U8P80_19965 [Rhizobium beringeri]WSH13858.1 hypothetical protein U8P74_19965 [Rhizobium beringeri]